MSEQGAPRPRHRNASTAGPRGGGGGERGGGGGDLGERAEEAADTAHAIEAAAVQQLVEMGFESASASRALRRAGNDVDQAIALLLLPQQEDP
jgi:hypothetical protein